MFIMSRNTRLPHLLLAAILAAPATALADTPGKYQRILNRNPFALSDPPKTEPTPVAPPVSPPEPQVYLTGLTSLFGKDRAYFKLLPPGGQEALYPALKVGEQQHGIELLAANLQAGEVRIRLGGREQTLTFELTGDNNTAQTMKAPLGNPHFLAANAPDQRVTGHALPKGNHLTGNQLNTAVSSRRGVGTLERRGNPSPSEQAIPGSTSLPQGQQTTIPLSQTKTSNVPFREAPVIDPDLQAVLIEINRNIETDIPYPPLPPTR